MNYVMNDHYNYPMMPTINFKENTTAQSNFNVAAPTPVQVPIPFIVPSTAPAQKKGASDVRSMDKALSETQRARI